MYDDTIKVANKIITDKDLMEIFQRMDEELKENIEICKKETLDNEKYEREYQNWTTKDFQGYFHCTFNFYDATDVKVDNYNSFITIFNNRLHEIKNMWISYNYSYWIQHEGNQNLISQSINMNIYEDKMDISVKLSSEDKKMDDVYQLIKEKILKAPKRYTTIVRKRSLITTKICFAVGMIPALIGVTLLMLVPAVREIFQNAYVLYPFTVLVLAYLVGNMLYGGTMNNLYSTITPEKKYAGWDSYKNKGVYKDDVDDFLSKSEIIIGKNIDNVKHRKEIVKLNKKYSKYIPIELIILLVLSIIIAFVGK